MSLTLFILGNGRSGYLDHTIRSWKENLITEPEFQIIFDDSGDKDYIKYLNDRYGSAFRIVPVAEGSVGQQKALSFIFNYLKKIDTDFYLQLEEDWVLNRPLELSGITDVLSDNPNILQMRIPRTIWYTEKHYFDLMYGGHMSWQKEGKPGGLVERSDGYCSWFEKRSTSYFWSHNPNVFGKQILNYKYPESRGNIDHEQLFGLNLLKKSPKHVIGYWAQNLFDTYVTHIGYHDLELEEKINSLIRNAIEGYM